MAKLNYQQASRNSQLARQPILSNDAKQPTRRTHLTRNKNIYPFGQYKGYHYEDIPEYYLRWITTTITDPTIRSKAEQALNKNGRTR